MTFDFLTNRVSLRFCGRWCKLVMFCMVHMFERGEQIYMRKKSKVLNFLLNKWTFHSCFHRII